MVYSGYTRGGAEEHDAIQIDEEEEKVGWKTNQADAWGEYENRSGKAVGKGENGRGEMQESDKEGDSGIGELTNERFQGWKVNKGRYLIDGDLVEAVQCSESKVR